MVAEGLGYRIDRPISSLEIKLPFAFALLKCIVNAARSYCHSHSHVHAHAHSYFHPLSPSHVLPTNPLHYSLLTTAKSSPSTRAQRSTYLVIAFPEIRSLLEDSGIEAWISLLGAASLLYFSLFTFDSCFAGEAGFLLFRRRSTQEEEGTALKGGLLGSLRSIYNKITITIPILQGQADSIE